jgi:hypothetical protein
MNGRKLIRRKPGKLVKTPGPTVEVDKEKMWCIILAVGVSGQEEAP